MNVCKRTNKIKNVFCISYIFINSFFMPFENFTFLQHFYAHAIFLAVMHLIVQHLSNLLLPKRCKCFTYTHMYIYIYIYIYIFVCIDRYIIIVLGKCLGGACVLPVWCLGGAHLQGVHSNEMHSKPTPPLAPSGGNSSIPHGMDLFKEFGHCVRK